jgi:hypothetical protein
MNTKTTTRPPANQSATLAHDANGMHPIFLPAHMVEKLRKLATAADIEGGADSFVAAVMGDFLRDGDAADILIDGWEITDPTTIAKIYEIQSEEAPRKASARP